MSVCFDLDTLVSSLKNPGQCGLQHLSEGVEVVAYTMTVYVASCVNNTSAVSGDRLRVCLTNDQLSGAPLSCAPKDNDDIKTSTLTFYCIVAPIIIFFVVLFPIDFYCYKMRRRKHRASVNHMESMRVGQVKAGIEKRKGSVGHDGDNKQRRQSRITGLLKMLRIRRSSTAPEILRGGSKASIFDDQKTDRESPAPDNPNVTGKTISVNDNQPILKPIQSAVDVQEGGSALGAPGTVTKNGTETLRYEMSPRPIHRKPQGASSSQSNSKSELDDETIHPGMSTVFETDEEFGLSAYPNRSIIKKVSKTPKDSLPTKPVLPPKISSSPFVRFAGKYQ